MMLRALPVLLFLVGNVASAGIDYALVPRIAPKLMKIQAAAGAGRVSIGTGVMVAKDTVVTNCHVTRDANYIEIWSGGQRFVASGQSADLGRDVCVLFGSGLPDLVAPIAELRWTQTEPRNGSAWRTLATASREVKQPFAAVDAGRKAVSLHPDDPNAWLSFGAACAAAGRKKGVDEARAALGELDPRYVEELKQITATP